MGSAPMDMEWGGKVMKVEIPRTGKSWGWVRVWVWVWVCFWVWVSCGNDGACRVD